MEQARRRRIVRITLLSCLGIGVLLFMASLDSVFAPLLSALLLAYILNPVVNWIQRAGIPRAAAIGVLFLAVYACLVGLIVLTVPAFLSQVGNLYESTVGEKAFDTEARPPEAELGEEVRRRLVRLDPPVPPSAPWFEDGNDDGLWQEGEVTLSGEEYGRMDPAERRRRRIRPQVVAYLDAGGTRAGDGVYDPAAGDVGLPRAEAEVYERNPDDRLVWLEPPWEGWVRWYVDEDGDGRYEPGYAREVVALARRLKERVTKKQGEAFERGLERVRDSLVATSTGAVESALEALSAAIYTLFGFLTAFILVPIYLFYFLLGLSGIRDRLFGMLPGRHRDRIIGILRRIDDSVSAFFRGRLIIMVIKGLVTGVVLAVLGVPFALVIGAITGIGSLIPIAGFLMGIVPAVCISVVDTGPGLALGVAGIFVAIEILENYFLGPWILRDRVGLHPVALIVSVFVGGALFGFVGMLLAVPMASVVRILYLEFVEPEVEALAAEEPGGG